MDMLEVFCKYIEVRKQLHLASYYLLMGKSEEKEYGLAGELLEQERELRVALLKGLAKQNKELTQSKARIAELEEALSKIIQTYPIDALGLTVDARMRETAREALSDKENAE